MIDLLVSQGYTLRDVEEMTLRQLDLFARAAVKRMDALKTAMGRRR